MAGTLGVQKARQLAVIDIMNAGETLYAEDETFFRSFAQSADWRAMQKMEEDFGDFYLSFTTT